jgi:hypothetical protein
MMKFATAFTALLLSTSAILAASVEFVPRDAWVPKVLYPDATTVLNPVGPEISPWCPAASGTSGKSTSDFA